MSRITFKMRSNGGLRSVFAQNPEPSRRIGDEGGGRIRCCISRGTGCVSQVSGKTGLANSPVPAFTSLLLDRKSKY